MHNLLYRSNALFTVSTTVLGVMCLLTALTDLTHRPNVRLDASVRSVDGLQRDYGDDRAWLSIKLDLDLRDLFTWNTKQVFVYALAEWATPRNHVNQAMVWSRIVQQPRGARVKEVVRIEYPYALTDQGVNLRGREYNLTVAWETTPVVGALHKGGRQLGGLRLPDDYFRSANVPRGHWRG
ncbi:hypothetical protein WJX81_007033 [Elliptochloris bilobata]|uniref:Signal peptidase complex subunit 3 n=1 Tax=Elliptochloris bilobata TaxID=381761 RepID=A0AAW1RX47_9CHLO